MSIRAGICFGLLVLGGTVARGEETLTATQWQIDAMTRKMDGDLRGAIAALDKAIALEPEGWLFYALRAVYKSELGDLAGAIADYTLIISRAPEERLGTFYSKRGDVRSRAGDHAGAMTDFDQAIKRRPDHAIGYNNRSVARNRAGNYAGALEDMTKAIALAPKSTRYLLNRATLYESHGEMAAAAKDYDHALELEPKNYNLSYDRAEFRRSQGDLEGAAADYTKAVEGGPDYAGGYLFRGMIRQAQGQWEAAATDYCKAVKALEPDTQDPVPYCEIALRQLGRGTPPADLAKLAAGWDDDWIKVTVQFLAGTVAESDLLARASQDTSKRGPVTQSLALYFAGMVRLQAGEAATARKYFEQYLALKLPDSIEATLVRAELARLAQKPSAAPAK